jgi:hypothetical protein
MTLCRAIIYAIGIQSTVHSTYVDINKIIHYSYTLESYEYTKSLLTKRMPASKVA